MKRLTVRADEVRVGDRLTEWWDEYTIGFAEGPGERVTELCPVGCSDHDHDPEDAPNRGMVEAWTDTGVIAGMPALTASPGCLVEVWR